MEIVFKEVQVYFEPANRAIFFSTGVLKSFGGVIAIGNPVELKLPCSADQIKEAADRAFKNCYTDSKDVIEKVSEIEKYLGVTGFKKATKTFEMFLLRWVDDQGFSIIQTRKHPKGHYDGLELGETVFGSVIDYKFISQLLKS